MTLFGVLMRKVQSVAALRAQRNMRRRQRSDILCRPVPVERLVRSLLGAEAIIHLLMTPQGRKLLATTPKIALPEPPPSVGLKEVHTAQDHHSDARLASPPLDLNETENWFCRFRVLGWRHPAPEDDPPPKEARRRRSSDEKLPELESPWDISRWIATPQSHPHSCAPWSAPRVRISPAMTARMRSNSSAPSIA
ncbi:MAG: hypothetical protein IPO30_21120 [Hyphomonadaceae bacterium]|mgnify:FL=1|nr:hypothetical protein [Hyphomonadaceae bacterium]